MDFSSLAVLIPVAVIVGFGVGVLSGMLGIGGGTVLVPIFKLGFGMSALASTATSLFTIVPTSVSGMITHIRNRTCIPKVGVASGLGGAITSPIGVWLATISPEWGTMVAAAAVIIYSSSTMFSKAIKGYRQAKAEKAAHPDGSVTGQSVTKPSQGPDSADDAQAHRKADAFYIASKIGPKQCLIGFIIGICAGVMSGYVGVGGGFLMIPMMMQLLGIPMRLTSGTSLIAVLMIAIPGTVTQAIYGNVDWILGICIAAGSIPGAIVGSKLMTKIPEVTLRFVFGGFLLIAAILLVLNQLNVF